MTGAHFKDDKKATQVGWITPGHRQDLYDLLRKATHITGAVMDVTEDGKFAFTMTLIAPPDEPA